MSPFSRLATAVAVAAAGLTLGAGAAQADTFSADPHTWCPGEALPFNNLQWNMKMCHTWYTVPFGQGNVRMNDVNGNALDSFISADIPPPQFPVPPPLPTKPPGTPFCSPRGALIIIPPICDEIGVTLP